jgi:hypothetical protein
LGYMLGEYDLDPLDGGYYYSPFTATVSYTPPPDGVYYTTFVLSEYTTAGWVTSAEAAFPKPAAWVSGSPTVLQLDKTNVIPFEYVVASGAFDPSATNTTVQLAYNRETFKAPVTRMTANEVRFAAPAFFSGEAFTSGAFEVSILQTSGGVATSNNYGKLAVANLPQIKLKPGMVTASFLRATQALLTNVSTNLAGTDLADPVTLSEITNAQGFLQSMLSQIQVPPIASRAESGRKAAADNNNPNAIALTSAELGQLDRFCAATVAACAKNASDSSAAEMFSVWTSAMTANAPATAAQAEQAETSLETSETAYQETLNSSGEELAQALQVMTAPFSTAAAGFGLYSLVNPVAAPVAAPIAVQLAFLSDAITTVMVLELCLDSDIAYFRGDTANQTIYLAAAKDLTKDLIFSEVFEYIKDFHSIKSWVNPKNFSKLLSDLSALQSGIVGVSSAGALLDQIPAPSETLSATNSSGETVGTPVTSSGGGGSSGVAGTWTMVCQGQNATVSVASNGSFSGSGWYFEDSSGGSHPISIFNGKMSEGDVSFDINGSGGGITLSGSGSGSYEDANASGTVEFDYDSPIGPDDFSAGWTATKNP